MNTKFVSDNASWGRIFSLYEPKWVIALMIISALISACFVPVLAYLVVSLNITFLQSETNPDWEEDAKKWLIYKAILVLFMFTVSSFEKTLFGAMGEKLTKNLRVKLIEEILHKQISWFDRQDRAPGIITNIISSDITQLNGMTSETVVVIFELVFQSIAGLALGFYFCW